MNIAPLKVLYVRIKSLKWIKEKKQKKLVQKIIVTFITEHIFKKWVKSLTQDVQCGNYK